MTIHAALCTLLLSLAQLAPNEGYLSAYDQRPTDATIEARQEWEEIPADISQYDALIAVIDCDRIGQEATLHANGHILNALVFDCAGLRDGGIMWMLQGGYVAEVDYYTWQRYNIVGSWARVEYHDR